MTSDQAIGGIIPPMTTPFDERGEVDIAAAQARWLLEAGVHGLAAGGVAQSSSGRPSQS